MPTNHSITNVLFPKSETTMQETQVTYNYKYIKGKKMPETPQNAYFKTAPNAKSFLLRHFRSLQCNRFAENERPECKCNVLDHATPPLHLCN